MPDPDSKRKYWEINPSIFKPGPRTSPIRRFIIEPARRLLKLVMIAALLTYPISLPLVGLAFGGLVFWGAFAGSIGLIFLVLTKTGYSRNFEAWNPSLTRQLVGLSIGFVMSVGFFLGLEYLKTWMVPVVFGIAGLGLALFFWKKI